MKKFFFILTFGLAITAYAQDVNKLIETAQLFIEKEDYANAKLVLNRAIQLKPDDYAIQQELAYVDYLSGDIDDAIEVC